MLREVLALNEPGVTALIGAGGKTTLLYRLGRELAAGGEAVVLTTTTRMYPPLPDQADRVIYTGDDPRGVRAAIDGIGAGKRLFVARGLRGGKVVGLTPDEVDALTAHLPRAWVLVEADGAAGRLLKGYAPHEPVVPPSTRLVLALAGLEVLGRPLEDPWVHRPEKVAAIAEARLGEPVQVRHLVAALTEALRRARNQAPGGRLAVWLNRPRQEGLAAARLAARFLLPAGAERCVLGQVREDEAPEVWTGSGPLGVGALVLAAGLSRRFGGNKLLYPLGGKTVLERVVDTALACPLEPVVVVLGHRADEAARALGDRPVVRLTNSRYREGLSASLKAGLAVLPPETRAVLVFLGDVPLVRRDTVEAILAAYGRTGAEAVYPTCAGRPGHPVLVDRRRFPDLYSLTGDRGARELRSNGLAVPVEDEGIYLDVDSPEDLEAVRRRIAPPEQAPE